MINQILLRRLARGSAAALLALSAVLAPAAAWADAASIIDLPVNPAASRDAVAEIFRRIDGGEAMVTTRDDVHPLTLAQLEDQLRRPELQASIGKGSIAVLYPNVEEPFRSAFVAMIQGIEERTKLRVRSYPVDPHSDTAELNAMLKRAGTKVVIALGRQGLNATAGLDHDISVLVGGVLLLSDSGQSSIQRHDRNRFRRSPRRCRPNIGGAAGNRRRAARR